MNLLVKVITVSCQILSGIQKQFQRISHNILQNPGYQPKAGMTHAFFLLLILLSFAVSAHAQTDALRVTVMPQYPRAFETVNIDVEDFSRDLNKVDITWSVNGKVAQHGVGLKTFQLSSGALGSVSNVSIDMKGVVSQVAIRPSAVDLLWQADTYTPPFYEGKALHTSQDQVTVMAEPFFVDNKGVRIDPATLVYKWTQDDKVNGSASGYGKNTFEVFPSILPRSINVQVEVSSADNSYHSASSIDIPNSSPDILFYENQPLYGINFARALNDADFNIPGSEAKITAIPYFFSNEEKDANVLTYSWALNNTPVNEQGNEVILRKPDNAGSGRSSISLGIKNLDKFLQSAKGSFSAVFNNPSNTSTNQGVF